MTDFVDDFFDTEVLYDPDGTVLKKRNENRAIILRQLTNHYGKDAQVKTISNEILEIIGWITEDLTWRKSQGIHWAEQDAEYLKEVLHRALKAIDDTTKT